MLVAAGTAFKHEQLQALISKHCTLDAACIRILHKDHVLPVRSLRTSGEAHWSHRGMSQRAHMYGLAFHAFVAVRTKKLILWSLEPLVRRHRGRSAPRLTSMFRSCVFETQALQCFSLLFGERAHVKTLAVKPTEGLHTLEPPRSPCS